MIRIDVFPAKESVPGLVASARLRHRVNDVQCPLSPRGRCFDDVQINPGAPRHGAMPALNCHKPEKSVAADSDGSKDEGHALTNDKFNVNVKKRTKTSSLLDFF